MLNDQLDHKYMMMGKFSTRLSESPRLSDKPIYHLDYGAPESESGDYKNHIFKYPDLDVFCAMLVSNIIVYLQWFDIIPICHQTETRNKGLAN